jgi:pyruvate/2-oxoglutarate dehydrogenase complex dihydrolipoamide acyltransferase (E2) component
MAYLVMAPMYKTMTSGKVDKYLVRQGDKVKVGQPVAEITAEGYFTLISEYDGIVREFYVGEGEYVEINTPLIEIEEVERV